MVNPLLMAGGGAAVLYLLARGRNGASPGQYGLSGFKTNLRNPEDSWREDQKKGSSSQSTNGADGIKVRVSVDVPCSCANSVKTPARMHGADGRSGQSCPPQMLNRDHARSPRHGIIAPPGPPQRPPSKRPPGNGDDPMQPVDPVDTYQMDSMRRESSTMYSGGNSSSSSQGVM